MFIQAVENNQLCEFSVTFERCLPQAQASQSKHCFIRAAKGRINSFSNFRKRL